MKYKIPFNRLGYYVKEPFSLYSEQAYIELTVGQIKNFWANTTSLIFSRIIDYLAEHYDITEFIEFIKKESLVSSKANKYFHKMVPYLEDQWLLDNYSILEKNKHIGYRSSSVIVKHSKNRDLLEKVILNHHKTLAKKDLLDKIKEIELSDHKINQIINETCDFNLKQEIIKILGSTSGLLTHKNSAVRENAIRKSKGLKPVDYKTKFKKKLQTELKKKYSDANYNRVLFQDSDVVIKFTKSLISEGEGIPITINYKKRYNPNLIYHVRPYILDSKVIYISNVLLIVNPSEIDNFVNVLVQKLKANK